MMNVRLSYCVLLIQEFILVLSSSAHPRGHLGGRGCDTGLLLQSAGAGSGKVDNNTVDCCAFVEIWSDDRQKQPTQKCLTVTGHKLLQTGVLYSLFFSTCVYAVELFILFWSECVDEFLKMPSPTLLGSRISSIWSGCTSAQAHPLPVNRDTSQCLLSATPQLHYMGVLTHPFLPFVDSSGWVRSVVSHLHCCGNCCSHSCSLVLLQSQILCAAVTLCVKGKIWAGGFSRTPFVASCLWPTPSQTPESFQDLFVWRR